MLIALYFVFIVLADIVAARWIVPVLPWWGIYAPAGVNQGLLQSISIASAIAFVASELVADTGVYHALGHRPWLVRVLGSNLVSAPTDSILFVGLAFGTFIGEPFWGGWQFMLGQTIAKIVLGAAWAGLVLIWRHNRLAGREALVDA